jgi:hypothetical protein
MEVDFLAGEASFVQHRLIEISGKRIQQSSIHASLHAQDQEIFTQYICK